MKTLKDKLIKVLDRVENHWCQNFMAKDAEGKTVWHFDPSATCWCIYGAAKVEGLSAEEWQVVRAASMVLFDHYPIHVNDNLGQESVIQLVKAVINEH